VESTLDSEEMTNPQSMDDVFAQDAGVRARVALLLAEGATV